MMRCPSLCSRVKIKEKRKKKKRIVMLEEEKIIR